MPGFQSSLRFFASFCIGQISHQQHKGKGGTLPMTESRAIGEAGEWLE